MMNGHILDTLECIGKLRWIAWSTNGRGDNSQQFIKLSHVFYLMSFQHIYEIHTLIQVIQIIFFFLICIKRQNKRKPSVCISLLSLYILHSIQRMTMEINVSHHLYHGTLSLHPSIKNASCCL